MRLLVRKLNINKVRVMLIICSILSFFLLFYFKKSIPELLVLKRDNIVIEYGQPISMELKDYLNFEGLNKDKKIQVLKNTRMQIESKNGVKTINDFSGKVNKKAWDFVKVGKYKLILTYKDEIKVVNLEVRDTVAPELTILKEIEIVQGTNLTNFDFKSLFKASDLAKLGDFSFDLTAVNVNEPGEYSIKVAIEDENKNRTEKEFKVKIIKSASIEKEIIKNNDETKKETTNNNVLNKPIKENISEPEKESFVANMSISKQTSQAIIVVGEGGSYATLTVHNKTNGLWNEVFRCPARIGKNGITIKKCEGDGKTPSGVYSFGQAFGVAANPGISRNWLQVNSNHYWVDDSNSQYYNKLVDLLDTEGIKWSSAEHLISYDRAYKYAIAINYNLSCIPGAGSAIFLHCSTGGSTAGCISVNEINMIRILKLLQNDTLIGIYPNANSIY